ncbi:MAG: hypothetical protein QOE55_3821 [Acidobacteriaceae bacterium]|nr:hypothetical protein [Acidobacteriaceae bacterium]
MFPSIHPHHKKTTSQYMILFVTPYTRARRAIGLSSELRRIGMLSNAVTGLPLKQLTHVQAPPYYQPCLWPPT